MGQMKETVLDIETKEETVVAEASPVELTHLALSLAFLPGKGWSLIEIKYNPVTGDVGPLVYSYVGEGKDYIVERLKIDTIARGVFNNSNQPY